MDAGGGEISVLTSIRTVAETESTNADLLDLVRTGLAEGIWLRAERQTAGRGRQGRAWVSPAGNFYGSTLVRLRPGDPLAATLGFVAAVALAEAVATLLNPGESRDPVSSGSDRQFSARAASQMRPGLRRGGLVVKWPNDLLIDGAKLSGILLERADDAVVVGIGVNLAHHPDLPDRPTTSLAAHDVVIPAPAFAEILADGFARLLERWRHDGFTRIRQRWLDLAHPRGTALAVGLPDGERLDGLFDGLDRDGALILRLASGERRVIHAADVFLV